MREVREGWRERWRRVIWPKDGARCCFYVISTLVQVGQSGVEEWGKVGDWDSPVLATGPTRLKADLVAGARRRRRRS
jgi:hypothetical protein